MRHCQIADLLSRLKSNQCFFMPTKFRRQHGYEEIMFRWIIAKRPVLSVRETYNVKMELDYKSYEKI
jgi:hypothetical protein